MNVLALILIVAIVLSAIAAPVVFALRRRARLTALIAGTIGFGAQAAFMAYLEATALRPEQGALGLLVGIPGVAIITCLISLLVITRTTSQSP